MLKFTNYVITRKHAQSVVDSFLLIKVLDVLGNNPVSLSARFTYYMIQLPVSTCPSLISLASYSRTGENEISARLTVYIHQDFSAPMRCA